MLGGRRRERNARLELDASLEHRFSELAVGPGLLEFPHILDRTDQATLSSSLQEQTSAHNASHGTRGGGSTWYF